jgi:hypothetical protein
VKALAISLALAASAHGDDLSITIDTRSPGLRIFKVQDALLSQSFDSHPSHDLPQFSLFGPRWKTGIGTSVFWAGESAASGGGVSNAVSAWDRSWVFNAPHQNPFYFALPYNDVENGHTRPEAASVIPWFRSTFVRDGQSVCHGRWIAIRHGVRVCYAQWEDVGPFAVDHWQYVFGTERPRPNRNQDAGLDVSPAVKDYLGLNGLDQADWRFVDSQSVPPGPWTRYGQNNVVLLKSK